MIPGQDPREMIQGEEPSLRKRYSREEIPQNPTAPPIQFNMQPAFDQDELADQEFDDERPPYPVYDTLDDEDDQIFPDGPTESQILSWKKQFNNRVFSLEINTDLFIFRCLSRYEYKQIVSLVNVDPLQREEIIAETCLLWPQGLTWQNMASMDAGLPANVAENVLDKSGFTKNIRVSQL